MTVFTVLLFLLIKKPFTILSFWKDCCTTFDCSILHVDRIVSVSWSLTFLFVKKLCWYSGQKRWKEKIALNKSKHFMSRSCLLIGALLSVRFLICILVRAIPVSFKLSKRKADENLQSLHTVLYGRKSNVRLPQVFCSSSMVYFIYFVKLCWFSAEPFFEEKHISIFWVCLDRQSSKFFSRQPYYVKEVFSPCYMLSSIISGSPLC